MRSNLGENLFNLFPCYIITNLIGLYINQFTKYRKTDRENCGGEVIAF